MNISSWVAELPVEQWAATVGRFIRRVRRRVLRRPISTAGGAVTCLAVLLIGGNALWDQDSQHPAPLWGAGDAVARAGDTLVASHTGTGSGTDDVTVRSIGLAGAAPDSLVEKMQRGLSDAGYFDGPIDGVLGDETAAAIRAFEERRGLQVTGRPSLGLLAAISEPEPPEAVETVSAEASEATANLQPPANATPGPAVLASVQEIQAALNAKGFGPVTVDGVMGTQTQRAFTKFTEARGFAGQGMTPLVLKALVE